MEDRAERVRVAHTYYLEYLKLMNHYELLEKLQEKAWKDLYKKHQKRQKGEETEEERPQADHPMMALARQMEDRDAKIAAFKLKKQIEGNLDRLKDY